MKVLSLFDGISCGMVALERAGVPVERYVAYEIDKYAIQISKKNYPQIEHCGDVTTADFTQYKGFDFVIGGSPCQNMSTLGDRKGLKGEKSKLFYEFARAIKEAEPKFFLLENNANMPKADRQEITDILGVEPIEINSSLFVPQNRKRLYWVGRRNVDGTYKKVEIFISNKRTKNLKDIMISKHEPIILCNYAKNKIEKIIEKYGELPEFFNPYNSSKIKDISPCLTTMGGQGNSSAVLFKENGEFCMLSAIEWERLQSLPENYTEGFTESKRKSAIGNGWTVDVIAHIFKGLR
jgi:DNA (cytosine-5)-methyltransferase 3A